MFPQDQHNPFLSAHAAAARDITQWPEVPVLKLIISSRIPGQAQSAVSLYPHPGASWELGWWWVMQWMLGMQTVNTVIPPSAVLALTLQPSLTIPSCRESYRVELPTGLRKVSQGNGLLLVESAVPLTAQLQSDHTHQHRAPLYIFTTHNQTISKFTRML